MDLISNHKLTRRSLIAGSAASLALLAGPKRGSFNEFSLQPPAFGIVPVVQFGKWVWKEPPKDKTGFVDPREYEVSVGIEWIGTGNATQLQGSTVAPLELPEQKIDSFEIQTTDTCEASVRDLTDHSAQLEVFAPRIERGQTIRAEANYKMTLYRNCNGLDESNFDPDDQKFPRDFAQMYLGSSPGIRIKTSSIKKIVENIVTPKMHPWQKAKIFHQWVRENIKGREGDYTSVREALKNRIGDCEERATVFIAFCRTVGIPARFVWIPNHAWAEFGLVDQEGNLQWIPSHTAAYPWFGWTGAHELVLQKGDKIRIPQTGKTQRLVKDWMRWRGSKPRFKFFAYVKPIASYGNEAGPGGRVKQSNGRWGFLGEHAENKYMRG